MMLDARGTPGRGKRFRIANHERLGQIEIPDHIAALRRQPIAVPNMDISRRYPWPLVGRIFRVARNVDGAGVFQGGLSPPWEKKPLLMSRIWD